MKTYPTLHRLLHWSIAVCLFVLFLTGMLRMTWMSKKFTGAVISKIALENNYALDPQTVKLMSAALLEPMFEWHIYASYLMGVLWIVRLVYMYKSGVRFPNPLKKQTTSLEKIQGLSYILFYLLVFIQLSTGAALSLSVFPDSVLEGMEKLHKAALYTVPLFVVVHLVGIALSEHGKEKGITSKMIGGA